LTEVKFVKETSDRWQEANITTFVGQETPIEHDGQQIAREASKIVGKIPGKIVRKIVIKIVKQNSN